MSALTRQSLSPRVDVSNVRGAFGVGHLQFVLRSVPSRVGENESAHTFDASR